MPLLAVCYYARQLRFPWFLLHPAETSGINHILHGLKVTNSTCLTVYFNSFLATLNARSKLREDPSHNVNSFINMQHLVSNGVQRPITQLVSPTPQEKVQQSVSSARVVFETNQVSPTIPQGHTTSATADSEVDYPRDTWKAAADSRGGVYSV